MNTNLRTIFIIILLFVAIPGMSIIAQHHDHNPEPKNPDRWTVRFRWQLPYKVMKEIGIEEGMTVADIGASEGYFTFYMSERVGSKGTVYASDIDSEALQVLSQRALKEKINNISVIHGTPEDPMLPENSIDLALIVNVMPMIQNSKLFLGNIAKGLKKDGTLVIIQWAAEKIDGYETNWEYPQEYSLRANLRKIYDGGFEVVKFLDFLPAQNIYVCKPRGK